MTTQVVTRWWWIRHAPVVDAHLGRLSGQADVDADVSDRRRFSDLAPDLPIDAVWILSNLKRTRQTAQALLRAGAKNSKARVEKAFAEQAFGDWTNKSWDEVGSGAEAEAFWQDPAHVCPPGKPAESFDDVCRRVAPRIAEITQDHAGRDIICVAHAGSIRAAVALALGLTPQQALILDIKNTTLTRLDFIAPTPTTLGNGSWRFVGLNQFGAPS